MPKLGAVQFLNFKKDRFDQEGKTFKEAKQRACKGGQKFRHRCPQFPAVEKTIPHLIPCYSHQLQYTVSNLEPFS